MMAISGGTQANYTGNALEQYVEHRLVAARYTRVRPQQFEPAIYNEQPIYTRRFHAGKSIYGTPIYADFAIYHPQRWPDCLIIEAKWQQVGGSVDEKYPYLVLNIQNCYCYPTILLLDGKGYKRGAEQWMRGQAGNKNLLHVFNMVEFQTWANTGNI
jgi:hypothetical protein